jgi:hypothetical protein
MMPERGRRLSAWKVLLFSALPLVVPPLLAEAGLRLSVEWPGESRSLPTALRRHRYQQVDPVPGYALRPGFADAGIVVNALGFRGPETSVSKPDGVLRIVAVGDSCTLHSGTCRSRAAA